MSTPQKSKGKYFERNIASKLREIFNLKDNECTRSPDSGNGEFEFGDIFFNDPVKYPYSLECKFGYKWDLGSMFPILNNQLSKFLIQSLEAKNKLETKMKVECKLNCVILSKPYSRIYVLTYQSMCDKLSHIETRDNFGKTVYIYEFDSLFNYLKEVI